MKRILYSLLVAALPLGERTRGPSRSQWSSPLMQKDLADVPGKEMVMLAVE